MNVKPVFYPRKYKRNEYEKYYNIIFIWDIVSDSEINECTFQFIYSFSGKVSEHLEFYRFLYRLRMDILVVK